MKASTLTGRRPLAELVGDFDGRVVCLSMSKDPNAKLIILMFRADETVPAYVAKVPTTDRAAQSVQLEASSLASLDRHRLGTLEKTVPRIVTIAEHEDRPVLVTTALPGRVMLASYHSRNHVARLAGVRDDFDAAGRWLAELHQVTARGSGDLSSSLDGVVPALERRFGEDHDLPGDIEMLGELRNRLSGYQVPRGVVHGDFWMGNLLVGAGALCGVIDWEFSRPDGLLTRDLARFVVAYSLYLDRHTKKGRSVRGHPDLRAGTWGAGVEYAIDGNGWFSELVRQFFINGLMRLGLPASSVRDIVLAEIARIATEADDSNFAKAHLLLLRRMQKPAS
ncbi:MAG: phosphotransferase family protein [Acidimicrobiales bacterium]